MKLVLALGGNALQCDSKDESLVQYINTLKKIAKYIVDIAEENNSVAIVHGNGPQLGRIISNMESSSTENKEDLFDICSAFCQGYMGYYLQRAINEEFQRRNISKSAATIITEVLVDKNDNEFINPTKPIGKFFTEKEAKILKEKKGYAVREDSGRGYRRVVPSPKPIDIIEKNIIKKMFNEDNVIVCCGGGGIPIVKEQCVIQGVPAVIDKDYAAEKIAEILDADILLVLTTVDNVCINYNKKNEIKLGNVSLNELKKYINENQFYEGSMLPKINACVKFIEYSEDKIAIITSLRNMKEALTGGCGTRIIK